MTIAKHYVCRQLWNDFELICFSQRVTAMSSRPSVSSLAHPTPGRLQGGRAGSLEFVLLYIAVLSLVIGIINISLGAGPTGSLPAMLQLVILVWVWAAAGILAWWRRQTNGIGGLLLVGAISIATGEHRTHRSSRFQCGGLGVWERASRFRCAPAARFPAWSCSGPLFDHYRRTGLYQVHLF